MPYTNDIEGTQTPDSNQETNNMDKQPEVGQAVKINFGFGHTTLGQITNVLHNSWGISYEITTEDGETEYTTTFETGASTQIGVHLINSNDLAAN